MAVKLGSTNISTIKLGSTDVTSAYLGSTLVFSSAGWEQQGTSIFGEASGDNWGEPVTISANGTRIAAGAFLNDGASGDGGGHVRAYYWTGTQWAQLGSDIDGLGYTSSPAQAAQAFSKVAMSGDGTRMVIGSHDQEFVKVFEYDTSSQDWAQLGSTIEVSEDSFGQNVAIDSDGDTIVIASPLADTTSTNVGAVRVYQYSSSTWSQVGSTITGAYLSYNLGRAVAITADGSTIAIGTDGNSANGSRVSIYENNSGTWSQVGSDIVGDYGDQFGHAVDISDDGTRVVIGAYLNDDAGTNNGQTQVYDFASGSWSQVGSDINGTSGAYAGYSVSITGDGTRIATGAPLSHSGNGCTKVFELSGSTWSQVGSDIVSGGQGGKGVALSDSNGKIVVGAINDDDPSQSGTNHGSVSVYEFDGSGGGSSSGSWSQLGSDIDGDANADRLGSAVAVSSDGLTFAAGAPGANSGGSGHVKIFRYSSGSWSQLGSDIDGQSSGDESGTEVAVSSDGETVAIASQYSDDGGSNVGHVRVFEYSSGSWSQVGSNISGEAVDDYSGDSIALSSDGSIVAIGTTLNDGAGSNAGHVRVFQYSSGSWSQLGSDIDGQYSGDGAGQAVSLSSNGLTVAVGAEWADGGGSNAGNVRVFHYSSGSWSQLGSDIDGETGDLSGRAVALSSDGLTVAIGAPSNDDGGLESGSVRVFEYSSGSWSQVGGDIPGENAGDNCGRSVALSSDGSIVAAGSIFNDDGGTYSGHVRVFQYSSGSWSQLGSDIAGEAANDRAYTVGISSDGSIVAIGAALNDDAADRAGHVRVYEYSST